MINATVLSQEECGKECPKISEMSCCMQPNRVRIFLLLKDLSGNLTQGRFVVINSTNLNRAAFRLSWVKYARETEDWREALKTMIGNGERNWEDWWKLDKRNGWLATTLAMTG